MKENVRNEDWVTRAQERNQQHTSVNKLMDLMVPEREMNSNLRG
jgi:hypothetical protein